MASGDFESHRLRYWGHQVTISARHTEVGAGTGWFLNLLLPEVAPDSLPDFCAACWAPPPLTHLNYVNEPATWALGDGRPARSHQISSALCLETLSGISMGTQL